MAHIYKSDGTPAGPSYGYATLAALQQNADNGDASAAILLRELSGPDQRLARGLVDTFSGKAESAPGKPPKRGRPKPPKPPKQSMRALWESDLHDPDPVRRLIAAKALAEMGR